MMLLGGEVVLLLFRWGVILRDYGSRPAGELRF